MQSATPFSAVQLRPSQQSRYALLGSPPDEHCIPGPFAVSEHVLLTSLLPMNHASRFQPFLPSPVKKHDPKKTKIRVHLRTRDIKLQSLQAQLLKLSQWTPTPEPAIKPNTENAEISGEAWMDIDTNIIDTDAEQGDTVHIPVLSRRTVPDQATINQYQRWISLLPELQEGYLQYLTEWTGVPLQPQTALMQCCSFVRCNPKTAKVLCLFLDCKSTYSFVFNLTAR